MKYSRGKRFPFTAPHVKIRSVRNAVKKRLPLRLSGLFRAVHFLVGEDGRPKHIGGMSDAVISVGVTHELTLTVAVGDYGAEGQELTVVKAEAGAIVEVAEAYSRKVQDLQLHGGSHALGYCAYLRPKEETLHRQAVIVAVFLI